jgi:hypothetical protein
LSWLSLIFSRRSPDIKFPFSTWHYWWTTLNAGLPWALYSTTNCDFKIKVQASSDLSISQRICAGICLNSSVRGWYSGTELSSQLLRSLKQEGHLSSWVQDQPGQ